MVFPAYWVRSNPLGFLEGEVGLIGVIKDIRQADVLLVGGFLPTSQPQDSR